MPNINGGFNGGLAAFTQAMKYNPTEQLSKGFGGLAENMYTNQLQGLVKDANYQNFSEKAPAMNALSLKVGKDAQNTYNSNMQQMNYDRINRVKAYDEFMKSGKFHNIPGSGSRAGSGGGAGVGGVFDNNIETGSNYYDVTDQGVGKLSNIPGMSVTQMKKLAKYQAKQTGYTPTQTLYQPSIGEQNPGMRQGMLNDMQAMFGLSGGAQTPSGIQQLTNQNNTTVQGQGTGGGTGGNTKSKKQVTTIPSTSKYYNDDTLYDNTDSGVGGYSDNAAEDITKETGEIANLDKTKDVVERVNSYKDRIENALIDTPDSAIKKLSGRDLQIAADMYERDNKRLTKLYEESGNPNFLNAISANKESYIKKLKASGKDAEEIQNFLPNLLNVSEDKWDPTTTGSMATPSRVLSDLENKYTETNTLASNKLKKRQDQTNANMIDLYERRKYFQSNGLSNTPQAQAINQLIGKEEQNERDLLVNQGELKNKVNSDEKRIDNIKTLTTEPLQKNEINRIDNSAVTGLNGINDRTSFKNVIEDMRTNSTNFQGTTGYELPVGIGQDKIILTGSSGNNISKSFNFLLKSAAADSTDKAIYYDKYMKDLINKHKEGSPITKKRAGSLYNWFRSNVKDTSGHFGKPELEIPDLDIKEEKDFISFKEGILSKRDK